jgi:branched-subunit amino acid aminotransferase/4-amino-4-deoxychorismate lyase
MIISANQKLIKQNDFIIDINSVSLNYGNLIFDSITLNNGMLFRVNDHIDRFLKTIRLNKMQLNLGTKEITSAIIAVAKANKLNNAYIRILALSNQSMLKRKKNNLNLLIVPLKKPFFIPRPISLGLRKLESNYMSNFKISGRYFEPLLKFKECINEGFDDVLLFDSSGRILETSSSNILFIKGDKIISPKSESTIKGITSATIKKLFYNNFEERNILVKDIKNFPSCLVCGTFIGIMNVNKIGKQVFNRKDKIYEIIKKKYQLALYGKEATNECWVTELN